MLQFISWVAIYVITNNNPFCNNDMLCNYKKKWSNMVDLEGQLVLQLSAISPYLKNGYSHDFLILQLSWHQPIGALHCVGDIVKMQALVLAGAYGGKEGGEEHDRPASKILPVTRH